MYNIFVASWQTAAKMKTTTVEFGAKTATGSIMAASGVSMDSPTTRRKIAAPKPASAAAALSAPAAHAAQLGSAETARAASGMPHSAKAQQVYLLLRDEILRGLRAPGSLLPGEPRLAAEQGVSRVTIRRALAQLEAEGLIERRPGVGTRICGAKADQRAFSADIASLLPEIVQMGERTTARLLSFAYVPAPPAVAAALGDSGLMQRAVRVRLIDGAPFSYLVTHVPEAIARGFSEADLATTPLFRLLERSGVVVARASQTVSATLAAPEVAAALELAPGAPLIALTRTLFDDQGRGVEHLDALYRPDRFRLEMRFERVGRGAARHWAPVFEPMRSAAE